MQAIFLLIKCTLGHAYDVAEDLVDNVTEISEVHSISGQYDLLVDHIDQKSNGLPKFPSHCPQGLRRHRRHVPVYI